jgi:hypothetical protein
MNEVNYRSVAKTTTATTEASAAVTLLSVIERCRCVCVAADVAADASSTAAGGNKGRQYSSSNSMG